MKTVAFKIIGDWVIAVFGKSSPTEQEGRELVMAFKTMDLDRLSCLVVTNGGAPSATMRKGFVDILQGRPFKTAVVSDATMVKGVVTALSWFNNAIQFFSMEHMDDAFSYLTIPETQFSLVRREVQKLLLEVDRGSPAKTSS